MENYFDHASAVSGDRKLLTEQVPLVPRKETWEVVDSPERLSKRFTFSERSRMKDFVSEVLNYEDEVNHHSMIRIDHLSVDIEVYTKDLNRITNLDREFASAVDEIFEDVRNYFYRQEKAPAFF